MSGLTVHQKAATRRMTYYPGRLRDQSAYSEGLREASGSHVRMRNCPRHEQWRLPRIQLLLERRAEIEAELARQVRRVSESFGARLVLRGEERAESIESDSFSDRRYCSSLRLAIMGAGAPARVEERPLPNSPADLLQLLDDTVTQFLVRASEVRRARGSVDLNELGCVLLRPKVAGQFFHETVGHLLEADTYRYVSGMVRDRPVCERITYEDRVTGYEETVGLNRVDDDGVPLLPVTLLAGGHLVDTIRTQSYDDGRAKLCGFARAQSFLHPCLPRMRVSVVRPWTGPNCALPRKLVVVDTAYNGTVSPATFRYVLRCGGYLEVDGERRGVFPDLRVSGDLFGALADVPHIGNDVAVFSSDCFKKGQIVRVAYGSPSIALQGQTVQGRMFRL